MRKIYGIAAAGLLALVSSSVWPAETPPATEPGHVVSIDNFTFRPATLTITAGEAVTWINRDDVPHTATSADRPKAFDSKTLDTDGKFTFTFEKPGSYKYFCAVHPHMTGVIVVKAK